MQPPTPTLLDLQRTLRELRIGQLELQRTLNVQATDMDGIDARADRQDTALTELEARVADLEARVCASTPTAITVMALHVALRALQVND